MVVLIAGSTGSLGSDIVAKLCRGGNDVRALVRGGSQHQKAKHLSATGATIVDGDLTRPETLFAACSGVDVVVSTATSMPTCADNGLRRVDLEGNLALIDAAERQGVRRFVYVSFSGNLEEDSPLRTAKRESERRLLSGKMEAVILRPSYFMEMWLSPALGFDPRHGAVRIYGSGDAKISYISAFDVADIAVAATTKHYPERSVVIEMGGPEAISQLDAVRIFEQSLGKEIKVEHVPVDALRAQHQSADPQQKTFSALMLCYAQGDVVHDAAKNAEDYGIKLTSVGEYASEFFARAASAT